MELTMKSLRNSYQFTNNELNNLAAPNLLSKIVLNKILTAQKQRNNSTKDLPPLEHQVAYPFKKITKEEFKSPYLNGRKLK